MYERPENAGAHDRFWMLIRDALRARGVAAPDGLDRSVAIQDGWERPDLVLGQTCGLPLRARLHDRVQLVATLDYGLPDTPPGHYRSLFVVRRDDTDALENYAGRRFAYNQGCSHSGWAAPQSMAGRLGFRFAMHRATGSHRHSAMAVAGGAADIAAIDAISWRAIRRHDPAARALKVIGRTDAAPGLALIAARGMPVGEILCAVESALADLGQDDRRILGLAGVAAIPLAAYLAIATPPGPGQAQGDIAET